MPSLQSLLQLSKLAVQHGVRRGTVWYDHSGSGSCWCEGQRSVLYGGRASAAAVAAAAGGSGGSRGATGSGQLRGTSFPSGGGVAPGEQEAISQEDDSEPVTKGASSGKGGRSGSGGRKSGSIPGAAGAAMLGVTGGEGGAEAGGDAEGLPGAVGDNEQLGDAGEVDYEGMTAGRRSDEGLGDEGADPASMCAPIMPRRVRHVPRQSSAINLGTRVGPAEMKRMAAELDSLKGENQLLQMQLQRLQQMQAGSQQHQHQQQGFAAGGREMGQCSPQAEGSAAGAAAGAAGGSSGTRLDALEREMAVLKQQVRAMLLTVDVALACRSFVAAAADLGWGQACLPFTVSRALCASRRQLLSVCCLCMYV